MFDSRVTRVLRGEQVFMVRLAPQVTLVSFAWAREIWPPQPRAFWKDVLMSDLQMLLVILKQIICIKNIAQKKLQS